MRTDLKVQRFIAIVIIHHHRFIIFIIILKTSAALKMATTMQGPLVLGATTTGLKYFIFAIVVISIVIFRSPFFGVWLWARHLFSSLHSFVAVSPTPTLEDSVSVRVICLFPDP